MPSAWRSDDRRDTLEPRDTAAAAWPARSAANLGRRANSASGWRSAPQTRMHVARTQCAHLIRTRQFGPKKGHPRPPPLMLGLSERIQGPPRRLGGIDEAAAMIDCPGRADL